MKCLRQGSTTSAATLGFIMLEAQRQLQMNEDVEESFAFLVNMFPREL